MLSTYFLATLLTTALAHPLLSLRSAGTTAADMILQIAPASNTCLNAPFPTECSTNTDAAPHLIQAFQDYAIYTAQEIAAILSLIAYESGDFKYNANHYPTPGNPGQGTRSMMMPNFVLAYASSIAALKGQVGEIAPAGTVTGLSADHLNQVLGLVAADQYTWASAAWFYESQCSAEIKQAVQKGGSVGWTAYMGCVGASASDAGRLAYWNRAQTAFGLA